MNSEAEGNELGREITASELLGLTAEDEAVVVVRLALYRKVKEARARSGLTQMELAQRLGSSQSRVAKAEAGDPSVSLEMLIKASVAAGATALEIGEAIRQAAKARDEVLRKSSRGR